MPCFLTRKNLGQTLEQLKKCLGTFENKSVGVEPMTSWSFDHWMKSGVLCARLRSLTQSVYLTTRRTSGKSRRALCSLWERLARDNLAKFMKAYGTIQHQWPSRHSNQVCGFVNNCHSWDHFVGTALTDESWTTLHVFTSTASSFTAEILLSVDYGFCLQCFDAVGWAAGRASGL